SACRAADSELAELQQRERSIAMEKAAYEERRVHAERALVAAERGFAAAEHDAREALALWTQAEKEAESHGVHGSSLLLADGNATGMASSKLAANAKTHAQLLVERVRRATGGAACATSIEEALSPQTPG